MGWGRGGYHACKLSSSNCTFKLTAAGNIVEIPIVAIILNGKYKEDDWELVRRYCCEVMSVFKQAESTKDEVSIGGYTFLQMLRTFKIVR